MAKLSARGRVEVARVVRDITESDGTEVRLTYVVMDDGWILKKHSFRYMGRLRASTFKQFKRVLAGRTPRASIEIMSKWHGATTTIRRPDLMDKVVRRTK